MAIIGVTVVAGTTSAEPLPAPAGLHKMFDDAQYKPLLLQLNKILPLNGELAKPYDKVDLAILKTNTLIMMKQAQPAVVAANDAVKLLAADTDAAEIAQARANQILIVASPNMVYKPKLKGAAPLPLDTTPRADALKALLTDRQADDANKLKQVKAANAMNQVIDLIAQVSQTRWVELAVTQSDTTSQTAYDDLVTEAQSLMEEAVPKIATNVKAISDNANGFTVVNHDVKNHVDWGYPVTRGLPAGAVRALKDDVATCNKISGTCDQLGSLVKDHGDDLQKISKAAQKVAGDATDLLKQFKAQ